MENLPLRVELSHSGRSWSVLVFPLDPRPHYVTGFFRPSDDGLNNELRRGVSWPSLGLIAPEEARRFGLAIETASRVVEEMSSVIKDGRVLARFVRREGKLEVTLTAGAFEAHLRVEDTEVVMMRKTGLGEFASLFHAWALAQIEERASYLRGLSDEDVSRFADPYEM